MQHLFRFHPRYFIFFILLLITEILIASFAHDRIIRPYMGDVLVVILIYCFVKSFLDAPLLPTAIAVLIFSFLVETLQYFQIVKILGLENSSLARTLIGTSFEWTDLLAYACGIGIVLVIERRRLPNSECNVE